MGFILQLSHFRKEWHFHLPQLMRDVQVGLRHCLLEGLGRREAGSQWISSVTCRLSLNMDLLAWGTGLTQAAYSG